MQTVKVKSIKSLKWSFLIEIFLKSIQPLTYIILAKILTPKDFGLIGIASIFIGLANILQEFGLGKTIIQKNRNIEGITNIVFWTNLSVGVLAYLAIFVSASALAQIFKYEELNLILKTLSLQILFYSLTTVHQSLLQKELNFKWIFYIKAVATLSSGVTSITMASLGYGVWSIVVGSLLGSFLQSVLFWIAVPWRPSLRFEKKLAREVYGFSIWVLLEVLLSWLIVWGDSLAIGYFLGAEELGIYRLGVVFVTLIFGFAFNPVISVVYPMFSKIQEDKNKIREYTLRIIKLIAFISFPMGMGIACFSELISIYIFGEKWQGVASVAAIIAIKDSIAWLVGLNPEVYRAIGRPDVNVKLLVLAALYYIPTYVVAAPYGLFVFTLSRLGVTVLGFFLHLFFLKKLLNLNYSSVFAASKIPFILSFLSAILLYMINYYADLNSITDVAIMIILSLVILTIYILAVKILDKDLYNDVRIILNNR
ncbi:MAG: lipopolysaccharide biosynthesis protein [Thermodesulfovibrio sp.]|nr:lipopolysaccharide biosynthesis protein [Thermodesulfovibrio sp.]